MTQRRYLCVRWHKDGQGSAQTQGTVLQLGKDSIMDPFFQLRFCLF